MFVQCFRLKIHNNHIIPLQFLYERFGSNIPKYLPLENTFESGTNTEVHGAWYLFCVDSRLNVKRICNKYDFSDNFVPYRMKIDPNMYNREYTIYATGDKKNPFELFKMVHKGGHLIILK